jgi:hypothetical protein
MNQVRAHSIRGGGTFGPPNDIPGGGVRC